MKKLEEEDEEEEGFPDQGKDEFPSPRGLAQQDQDALGEEVPRIQDALEEGVPLRNNPM